MEKKKQEESKRTMAKTLINCPSRYPISRKKIRLLVENILGDQSVDDKTEVSILFTGERKMRALNKTYRQKDLVTNVLSFPLKGTHFPDDILRLGDIVICYPVAREEAGDNNIIVDEEIDRLVKHGVLSLLGLEE